jgi:hypothetical protein
LGEEEGASESFLKKTPLCASRCALMHILPQTGYYTSRPEFKQFLHGASLCAVLPPCRGERTIAPFLLPERSMNILAPMRSCIAPSSLLPPLSASGSSAVFRASSQLHALGSAVSGNWLAQFGDLLPLWKSLSIAQHHEYVHAAGRYCGGWTAAARQFVWCEPCIACVRIAGRQSC